MRSFSVLILCFLLSCSTAPERELAEIRQIMADQVVDWNEGDIDGFMSGYWNDPRLVFTGGKGITKGWQQALDRYKNSYPSQEQMGTLEFNDLDVELIATDVAFTTGEWKLYRTADTLSGRFTLVWKKIDGGWHIIADHSS